MTTEAGTEQRPETLAEVSKRTGLNYWWLRRMCSTRQIAFTKVGREYCLSRDQIDAATLKRNKVVNPADQDDVARENERRASRPRRRRTSAKAA